MSHYSLHFISKDHLKKIVICLAFVWVLAALLSGCDRSEESWEDFQIGFSPSGYSSMMTGTEESWYLVNPNVASFGYLHEIDKETMEERMVCHVEGCDHHQETDPQRAADCQALIRPYRQPGGSANYSLQSDGSFLYFLEADADSPWPNLMRMSLEDGTRETLYAFEGAPTKLVLHRGEAFFTQHEEGVIYRLSLTDLPQAKPSLLLGEDEERHSLRTMIAKGSSLYYLSSQKRDDPYQLIRHDLESDQQDVLREWSGYFTIAEEHLISVTFEGNLKLTNLDGQEPMLIDAENGTLIGGEDGFHLDPIFLASLLPDEYEGIKTYDLEGNQTHVLDRSELNLRSAHGCDSQYLFFPRHEPFNDFSQTMTLIAFDRSELFQGEAEPFEVFHFEPDIDRHALLEDVNESR